MNQSHPQYIIDTAGKKMVILPAKEFEQMIENLEELEDIRIYDKAKSKKETFIPIDEAFNTIELKRKKKN